MTAPVTTTPLDVNQAFATERAGQLAAIEAAGASIAERQARFDQRVAEGKMRNLGGGRYKVNEPGTWDDGEVFQVQPNGMVMPQHGLDLSTGQAALYTRVPAWHGLGEVIPKGVVDIDTVLRLGKIDFTVVKRPVQFTATDDEPGYLHTMPGQFVTVRDDTSSPLGVVGDRYTPIQNRSVFEFLQDLTEHYDIRWESAGGLKGGKRVFVSMRLPEDIVIDAAGVNDVVRPFIVAINSHDGNSEMRVVVTPWRPVCGNTERFAVRDALTRWGISHHRSALDRMAEARKTLGLSLKFYQQFAAEETKLAQADLAIADFHALCGELWPLKDDTEDGKTPSKAALTLRDKRQSELDDLWLRSETTANCHGTAYGAERAVTEFLDWKTAVKPGAGVGSLSEGVVRATSAMLGNADKKKTAAHKLLMQRVS